VQIHLETYIHRKASTAIQPIVFGVVVAQQGIERYVAAEENGGAAAQEEIGAVVGR
jgi:hypothetical protein